MPLIDVEQAVEAVQAVDVEKMRGNPLDDLVARREVIAALSAPAPAKAREPYEEKKP